MFEYQRIPTLVKPDSLIFFQNLQCVSFFKRARLVDSPGATSLLDPEPFGSGGRMFRSHWLCKRIL
jgi:hypothetical protein